MLKKEAFGYADVIRISEERANAALALDSAVICIVEVLKSRDLKGLWDYEEDSITDEALPVADLVNKLIEVRNELLDYEHNSDLTVEALVGADARKADAVSSLPSLAALHLF